MQLPFTHEQFLDVFGAYNRALWPAAVLLWLATVLVVVRWLRAPEAKGPEVSALLAVHWVWSGLAYHAAFFRHINPAAVLFAALFVLEAAIILWLGLLRKRLTFEWSSGTRGAAAMVLVGYAVAYPVLGLLFGLSYPRAPSFGVPCPTAILTIGWLLVVGPGSVRILGVIPLLWSVVGGSAAFLLGIRTDLMLVAAGILLAAAMVAPKALQPQRAV